VKDGRDPIYSNKRKAFSLSARTECPISSILFQADSREYESYVLEDEGKILGVLCIQKQTDSLHISRLGVRKGHWRKGYEKELLKFTISKARERGTQKISLGTETENVEFYKGFGFKTT
jgi:ribosomal protein S18 acetylase RimI-like enzyme